MSEPDFKYEIPLEGTGALVAVIMGSQSDWPTMEHACRMLDELGIPWKRQIISAHRTPQRMMAFAETAVSCGFKVIIAGAGGAAHLAGMVAGSTILPVFGVPIKTSALGGVDSVWSMLQMPKGVPVGVLAIGEAGALNAALQAARVLALMDPELAKRYEAFVENQTACVAKVPFNQSKRSSMSC